MIFFFWFYASNLFSILKFLVFQCLISLDSHTSHYKWGFLSAF